MKEEKTVNIRYICEYCLMPYYNREKAIQCEASHTPVSVGSTGHYDKTYHYSDHGKPYSETHKVSGTIIKEEDGKFLIEHDDGSRKWIHTWETYR